MTTGALDLAASWLCFVLEEKWFLRQFLRIVYLVMVENSWKVVIHLFGWLTMSLNRFCPPTFLHISTGSWSTLTPCQESMISRKVLFPEPTFPSTSTVKGREEGLKDFLVTSCESPALSSYTPNTYTLERSTVLYLYTESPHKSEIYVSTSFSGFEDD